MTKTFLALAALFASAVCAPAAQACDLEEMAEGECRGPVRMLPSLRQIVPPAIPSPPAIAKEACDPDETDDLKSCLRGVKVPGTRQLVAPAARPAAEVPARVTPDKTTAVPSETAVASTEKPAKQEDAPLCQKYLPSIGQSVSVPCE